MTVKGKDGYPCQTTSKFLFRFVGGPWAPPSVGVESSAVEGLGTYLWDERVEECKNTSSFPLSVVTHVESSLWSRPVNDQRVWVQSILPWCPPLLAYINVLLRLSSFSSVDLLTISSWLLLLSISLFVLLSFHDHINWRQSSNPNWSNWLNGCNCKAQI